MADEQRIHEEYEDNVPTGVEVEDPGDDERSILRPYDATKIRVDPKTFSLRNIVDMVDEGDLDLAPDFQRKKVWKPGQKSRLIESLLLRIPLPAFYFSADNDGTLRVVDGLQRLSTVHDFVLGRFRLVGLEYLKDTVEGRLFNELDSQWSRRILQTQIFANVIDPQTPDQVKFDIFKRINTGGNPLNSQEIRHCMSHRRSRAILKACTATELPETERSEIMEVWEEARHAARLFHEATSGALADHPRMTDREMVLRFFAFRHFGTDRYSTDTTMDTFLTEATRALDSREVTLVPLVGDLTRALRNAIELFGKHAFRKWPLHADGLNPVNRALFESWAVPLADYEWEVLAPYKEAIVAAARVSMTDDFEYINAVSYGTGDTRKVARRFNVPRTILAEEIA